MAGFEQMDKLLLRAQVLQQSALETLEKSVAGLENGAPKRLIARSGSMSASTSWSLRLPI
jgi:hypothetical protein